MLSYFLLAYKHALFCLFTSITLNNALLCKKKFAFSFFTFKIKFNSRHILPDNIKLCGTKHFTDFPVLVAANRTVSATDA